MRNIFSICFILSAVSIFSQSSDDFGYADKSIPELSQFEYYRGEWKAEFEMKQEDGSFKKLNFTATIKGQFLNDHKTFQNQFIGSEGFFSTDIRTYNTKSKEWEALFLNATAQRWHKFSSRIIDGKMTTYVLKGYSGKEDFDLKIIDTVLSENKYLRNVYYSYDQMKNWDLIYKITINKQ